MDNVYRFLFLLLLIGTCYSANILAILTLASPSHYIWHKGILLELIKQDYHNITVITHEKDLTQYPNYTVISMDGVTEKLMEDFGLEDSHDASVWKTIKVLIQFEINTCKLDFETDGFKTLLNYPKNFKFDLIIFDITTGRCMYPLIDKFGRPPVIATCPFGNKHSVTYPFGNHIFSHIPYFQTETIYAVKFWDRLKNLIYNYSLTLLRRYLQRPIEQAYINTMYGNDVRTIDEYERDFSLLLVSSNPVLDYPESFYPNTIPVGGIHVKPSQKLPKDIQAILDEAKNGVIVVSFGTNVRFNKVDERVRSSYIGAFGKLQQTVLIKATPFDFETPKNVIVREWLPQNDILAHPNVRLIMTHGGALSSQEAMHHGVPIICIPFYLDQHLNAAKFEQKKLGKRIKADDVSLDLVYDTVTEVLNNPIYKRNMMDLSRKFRDQPQTPMERAIFWIRYVLRHKDISHLSPVSRDFSVIQRLDLDIAAFLLTILFTICFITYKLILYLCSCGSIKSDRKWKLKVN